MMRELQYQRQEAKGRQIHTLSMTAGHFLFGAFIFLTLLLCLHKLWEQLE